MICELIVGDRVIPLEEIDRPSITVEETHNPDGSFTAGKSTWLPMCLKTTEKVVVAPGRMQLSIRYKAASLPWEMWDLDIVDVRSVGRYLYLTPSHAWRGPTDYK